MGNGTPPECPLHLEQLQQLSDSVEKLTELTRLDGPIATLRETVRELARDVKAIDRRVDDLEVDVRTVGDRLWSVAVGAGGIAAGITGIVGVVVYLIFGR
jgi:hypothetical protein